MVKHKDSQKSKLNHNTTQELHGEKTMKEDAVLNVGEYPQRNIPGKTHAISWGLKTQSAQSSTIGFEVGS